MLFYDADPILIAAAVIPAIFLLIQVNRADKLDKEPQKGRTEKTARPFLPLLGGVS